MEIFDRFMKIKEITTNPESISKKIDLIKDVLEITEIERADLKTFIKQNFGTIRNFANLTQKHCGDTFTPKYYENALIGNDTKSIAYKSIENYLNHLGFKIKGE